jgi:hypothetical protein
MPIKSITCSYTTYVTFTIPEDVKKFLFTREENSKEENEMKPGSWWIKWAIFHYIDKEGKEQEIQSDDEPSTNWKYADDEEIEDEEDNSDSESDDESDDE